MNPLELVMRRRNVAEFIRADPARVQFIRSGERIKTAAGGFVASIPTTLSPQRVRILPNKRRYNSDLINSEAGEIPDSEWLLLGLHTLDVKVDDRFQWMGAWYQVTGIHPFRTESTLCAINHDGAVNHG